MKLRVPNEFTGWYGMFEFKDGVTVNLVSPKQANLLRAIMTGVEVMEDDGVTVDEALNALPELFPVEFYTHYGNPPPSKYLTDWQGKYPVAFEPAVYGTPESEAPAPAPAPVVAGKYSRADLEKIVDEKGIKGLREIAPEGVTARSVNDLIEAILNAV